MTHHKTTMLSCIVLVLTLAACGGSEEIASAPPPMAAPAPFPVPTPSPSPPASTRVEILEAPATQEFATFTAGVPMRIRYDATADKYEVMAAGPDWRELYVTGPASENSFRFAPGGLDYVGSVYVQARHNSVHPDSRYRYSSLASWSYWGEAGKPGTIGSVAFGTPTPAGGVPVTGTANYQGRIIGEADVPSVGWGESSTAPLGGTVLLNFNFGSGSLTGRISPWLACDCNPIEFPQLEFGETTFAIGSQTFSGKFDTSVSGTNTFSGMFTGPHAEELIGRWTFPFLFDGTPHSATGVWIAKR